MILHDLIYKNQIDQYSHELIKHYHTRKVIDGEVECQISQEHIELNAKINAQIQLHISLHPGESACLLKAKQTEIIAQNFRPKIFVHSPFFFEMGIHKSEGWGIPETPESMPSTCLLNERKKKFINEILFKNMAGLRYVNHQPKDSPLRQSYWLAVADRGFDWDHHCLGYSNLLRFGFAGVLENIQKRRRDSLKKEQEDVLDAMQTEIRAIILVAQKFSEEAKKLLVDQNDKEIIANLEKIRETALKIPYNPPTTFYEGLAMIFFLREAISSLDALGISVLGHPDRQLIELYNRDLNEGRITPNEAEALIALWMLPIDIKTFARERKWPETSSCIVLGGCDHNGDLVWNDLTKMFIGVHSRLNLINPKLNCRISHRSPQEYLELLAVHNLSGHNNFAFLNDDVLIPANIRYGKTQAHARCYVAGGCQEVMCEGVEHSAGAGLYINLPAFFHVIFAADSMCSADKNKWPAQSANALPEPIVNANDFEDFYQKTIQSVKHSISMGAMWMREQGKYYREINPAPAFSSTLEGCVERCCDYTSGGALYNRSGITLVGFGDLVNCLYSVRELVYPDMTPPFLSLSRFQQIIRENWNKNENLRMKVLMLPRFGQGNPDVDKLASRLARDLAEICSTLPNERGGYFQPSFFVYWQFALMGQNTNATPDGRKSGDYLSQGLSPHRVGAPASITNIFHSLSHIDLQDYPGNAVLDILLPFGSDVSSKNLVAVLRTFIRVGGATIQINCVNIEDLHLAQRNPIHYSNLIVRISGLSACFVCLDKEVQNEIMSRAMVII